MYKLPFLLCICTLETYTYPSMVHDIKSWWVEKMSVRQRNHHSSRFSSCEGILLVVRSALPQSRPRLVFFHAVKLKWPGSPADWHMCSGVLGIYRRTYLPSPARFIDPKLLPSCTSRTLTPVNALGCRESWLLLLHHDNHAKSDVTCGEINFMTIVISWHFMTRLSFIYPVPKTCVVL